MADLTDEEKLAALETALDNILANGQKKSIRGKTVEYADPAKIQARIDELRAMIAGSSRRATSNYLRRVRG